MNLIYQDSANIDSSELAKVLQELNPYILRLSEINTLDYEEPECSICLPGDGMPSELVREAASRFDEKRLKYVLVIGIGGSNLGTQAIYEALRGQEYASLSDTPKLLFLDTVAPKRTQLLLRFLDENVNEADELVVNVISKSGSTTETIAGMEIMYAYLQKRFEEVNQMFVFTTDEGSKLWEKGKKMGINLLSIPKMVGGRYSVFSTVGLFPLLLGGIDIESLLSGAEAMKESCVQENETNPAAISAALTFLHNSKGNRLHNSFFFNPEMESVGKWYRQLMGESIGKSYDTDGKEVHAGITPLVTIGSADLHSMVQLYFGGPRDKYTNLIYVPHKDIELEVGELAFPGLVEGIGGKSYDAIMKAIYEGVKAAYRKNNLPFMEIELAEINEHELGGFLQFRMIEMMYLANLLKLNAFDQPNVEDYKSETRKLLVN